MEGATRWYQQPGNRARLAVEGPPNVEPEEPDTSGRGFVELFSRCDGDLLRKLILAAYEASRDGTVILALNGVSPETVDGHLDSVVRENGWGLGDLRYVPADTVTEELLKSAAKAEFVIVHSTALSAALLSRGTGYMSVSGGIRYLANLARLERESEAPPVFAAVG